MKFFNTAGPIKKADHYNLDPLSRVDLDDLISLIRQEKYFVLHAPRQTGKTSMMLTLMDQLNRGDEFRCLYMNVESAQAAREDVKAAMMSILFELADGLEYHFGEQRVGDIGPILESVGPHSALRMALTQWTSASDKPLVLLIDEVDALVGDTLISVLRQLRTGYPMRPARFPQSIILCGVRDVRDYRIHASSEKDPITGGSAFNVKAKSLRMGNFSEEEVHELLLQHTHETGQVFTPEALAAVWDYSQGQPWLVNALAYEVTYDMKPNRNPEVVLTEDMVRQARENLILRRETHLDQLADKLKEPRVHRVVAPILASSQQSAQIREDDVAYVYDLGLVERKPLRIANPIYQEIIPRTLTSAYQETLTQELKWYLNSNGLLDMTQLMPAFQQFFRENSEFWTQTFQYKEAGPQLLLQAFLQRVINGGGRIEREYGLGSGRTDLYLTFPHETGVQRLVLELKLRKGTREKTIENALPQVVGYMDRCNADEGHLILFDQTDDPWDTKIFHDQATWRDHEVQIWGM